MRSPALAVLFALAACRRSDPEPGVHDANAAATALAPASSVTLGPTPSSGAPEDPGAPDDACAAHDECVPLDLFVGGELRCCLSCGATAAVAKRWAARFGAFCAATRAMADCPIADCVAKRLDARCVAGHCVLVPRP